MFEVYIGVVGSRHYSDYDAFADCLADYIAEYGQDAVIISGGANGADALAERYANEELEGSKIIYPPDPEIVKSRGFTAAAHKRNQQIVDKSDFIIAFVGPNSKGTWDTIKRAIKAKKHVIIIPVEE